MRALSRRADRETQALARIMAQADNVPTYSALGAYKSPAALSAKLSQLSQSEAPALQSVSARHWISSAEPSVAREDSEQQSWESVPCAQFDWSKSGGAAKTMRIFGLCRERSESAAVGHARQVVGEGSITYNADDGF